eukprot:g24302.t1
MADRNAQLAARIAAVKPVPATVQLLEKQLLNGDAEIREQGVESITKIQPPPEPLTVAWARSGALAFGSVDVERPKRSQKLDRWYVRRTTAAAVTKCAELDEDAELAIHKVAAAQLEHEESWNRALDPDVRCCVARALLAIHKASVNETPAKTCALGIERRVFKAKDPEEPRDQGEGEEAPLSARSEDSMAGAAQAGCVDVEYGDLAVMEIAQRLAHEKSSLSVRPREIRELALNTLAQMGAAAEPYGRKLGQMLADDEVSVSVAALAAFEQLGAHAQSGIEETLMACSKESGEEVVQRVINCLGELQPKRKEAREKASGRRTPPGSKNSSEEAPINVVIRAVLTLLCDLGPLQGDFGALVAPHMKVIMPYMEDPEIETCHRKGTMP